MRIHALVVHLFPALVFFGMSMQAALPAAALGTQDPSDFREVIRSATSKVFPSVVYIRCVVENFEQGTRQRQSTSGSGVIISESGEVVTNWHVVDNAVEVRCLLEDGRAFPATVIGSDKDTDIALLRLKLPEGERVPVANLAAADAPTAEGSFVMAMGAPWGLNRSVSLGILSCARRYLPEASEYSIWLQTDAAISPGNSGGPLVDTRGEVIGINARGVMQGGDLGFAIPVETVRVVVPRLREHGEARWGWTGLQLQPLRDFGRNVNFDADSGVIIAGTDPASPANEAGFRANDRITSIEGVRVTAMMEEDLPSVRRRLALLPEGRPARLVVVRDGAELALELTPRAKGRVQGAELDLSMWDFTVKEINPFEVPDLHFHSPSGLYVRGVRMPGNAAMSGLQARDILTRVNGVPVQSLDDLRRLHTESLARLEKGGSRKLLLGLLRNGQPVQIAIELSRNYDKS